MDTNAIRDTRSFINKKILEKKLLLERTKVNNQKYEALEDTKIRLDILHKEFSDYVHDLSLLKTMISEEDLKFRDRRIDYLNDVITEKIKFFFPWLGFRAKVSYNDKYNSTKAVLRLVDSAGISRKPSVTEGQLCQYLISFAAVDGVVTSLGNNTIYIDEAFGVAAKDKLSSIGQVLAKAASLGRQIIIIAQDPLLYEAIPHREIRLELDFGEEGVINKEIDSTIDFVLPDMTKYPEVKVTSVIDF